MIFRQTLQLQVVDGDGEHGELMVVLGNFIVENAWVVDDDVAGFDIVTFVIDEIGTGAGADKQKLQAVFMVVKNPGMLAEADGDIAGRQQTGHLAFLKRRSKRIFGKTLNHNIGPFYLLPFWFISLLP